MERGCERPERCGKHPSRTSGAGSERLWEDSGRTYTKVFQHKILSTLREFENEGILFPSQSHSTTRRVHRQPSRRRDFRSSRRLDLVCGSTDGSKESEG